MSVSALLTIFTPLLIVATSLIGLAVLRGGTMAFRAWLDLHDSEGRETREQAIRQLLEGMRLRDAADVDEQHKCAVALSQGIANVQRAEARRDSGYRWLSGAVWSYVVAVVATAALFVIAACKWSETVGQTLAALAGLGFSGFIVCVAPLFKLAIRQGLPSETKSAPALPGTKPPERTE